MSTLSVPVPEPSAALLMREALAHHEHGRLPEAEGLCREVLRQQPHHPDALHLLGLIAVHARRLDAGVQLLRQSLAADPHQPFALSNLAAALQELNRPAEALECSERALALQPQLPIALTNRANALRALGRPAEALQSLERALALRSDDAVTLNDYGSCCMALGRSEQACRAFEQALHLRPRDAVSAINLSIACLTLRQHDRALTAAQKAVALDPARPAGWLQLARVQIERQAYSGALEALDQALACPSCDPQQPEALWLRGIALQRLRRIDEALETLRTAVTRHPEQAAAWSALAGVLCETRHVQAGIDCLNRALALRPDDIELLMRRGYAHRLARHNQAAAEDFERVVALDANRTAAWYGLGMALRVGDPMRASVALAQALRADPESEYALGALHYARASACDWSDYAPTVTQLNAGVSAGRRIDYPFTYLSVSSDADSQLRCARITLEHSAEITPLPPAPPYSHQRLRIGYLSGDLREHPVAYLIAGLLERHDRARFEIFALSLQPVGSGPYGARISAAVDHFVDLSACSDRAAAERIRALEIDILIDLVGHTASWDIAVARPAPLQVNYLGYPGTLGAPYIDYIIADAYLIPEAQRTHYAEQVLTLPDCFQANDDRRARPEPTERSDLALPEHALVLCCFNNSYKLNPAFFEVWMRLLAAHSDAVLWLVAGLPIVEQNLRREAAARGINPARLHFAHRLPYEQHLSRLAAADLFLDTLPFNGGTTVSDALWMGVPVLACSGQAFAARMAGSLLTALGLPELIASDLAHYERRALELLEQPQQLAALRERLREARTSSALFDTTRFTRHFEAALIAIQERFERGLPVAPLEVPRMPASASL